LCSEQHTPRQARSSLSLNVRQKYNHDRKARDSLAERLRQLASGAITNFEFEDRAPDDSKCDPAIWQIYYGVAWPKYDDFSEQRMTGTHSFTSGERQDVARCVMFLKSDLEFRWPARSIFSSWLIFLSSVFRRKGIEPVIAGDRSVWPFFIDEYRNALKHPPYLK
jgi:hypothetical protein